MVASRKGELNASPGNLPTGVGGGDFTVLSLLSFEECECITCFKDK